MLVWLTFIFLYPVGMTLGLSFFSLALVEPLSKARFVGLNNFTSLLRDSLFWNSVKTTILYTAVSVSGVFFLGLLMALIANVKFKGRILARALLIVPWTLPPVAFCMIWYWMLDFNFGIINQVLLNWHLITAPIRWLFSPSPALATNCLVTIWFVSPLAMLVFLAGLQTVPLELYEAADMDGAGILAKFVYITWPGIKSSRDLLLVLLTIWIFRAFVIIFLLTSGGPGRTTETLIVKTYMEGFKFFRLGLASAVATVVMGILGVTVVLYVRIMTKQKKEVL